MEISLDEIKRDQPIDGLLSDDRMETESETTTGKP